MGKHRDTLLSGYTLQGSVVRSIHELMHVSLITQAWCIVDCASLDSPSVSVQVLAQRPVSTCNVKKRIQAPPPLFCMCFVLNLSTDGPSIPGLAITGPLYSPTIPGSDDNDTQPPFLELDFRLVAHRLCEGKALDQRVP